MPIYVYLNFNGNCREAVQFYLNVFDCEPQQIMTFGDAHSDEIPKEAKDYIMHTFLIIKGTKVMFSDTFPGMPFNIGNNINLTVNSDDIDELKRIFNKLKEGGKVEMELQETFWSKCYGSVTDQFGVNWLINYENNH